MAAADRGLEGGSIEALGLALLGDKPGGVTHLPDGNTEMHSGRSQLGPQPRLIWRTALHGHGSEGWLGVGNPVALPVSDLTLLLSRAICHQPLFPLGSQGQAQMGLLASLGTALHSRSPPSSSSLGPCGKPGHPSPT